MTLGPPVLARGLSRQPHCQLAVAAARSAWREMTRDEQLFLDMELHYDAHR